MALTDVAPDMGYGIWVVKLQNRNITNWEMVSEHSIISSISWVCNMLPSDLDSRLGNSMSSLGIRNECGIKEGYSLIKMDCKTFY